MIEQEITVKETVDGVEGKIRINTNDRAIIQFTLFIKNDEERLAPKVSALLREIVKINDEEKHGEACMKELKTPCGSFMWERLDKSNITKEGLENILQTIAELLPTEMQDRIKGQPMGFATRPEDLEKKILCKAMGRTALLLMISGTWRKCVIKRERPSPPSLMPKEK